MQQSAREEISQRIEGCQKMRMPNGRNGVMACCVFTNGRGDYGACALAFVNEQREHAVLTGVPGEAIPVLNAAERTNESDRVAGRARKDAFELRRLFGRARGHRALG